MICISRIIIFTNVVFHIVMYHLSEHSFSLSYTGGGSYVLIEIIENKNLHYISMCKDGHVSIKTVEKNVIFLFLEHKTDEFEVTFTFPEININFLYPIDIILFKKMKNQAPPHTILQKLYEINVSINKDSHKKFENSFMNAKREILRIFVKLHNSTTLLIFKFCQYFGKKNELFKTIFRSFRNNLFFSQKVHFTGIYKKNFYLSEWSCIHEIVLISL